MTTPTHPAFGPASSLNLGRWLADPDAWVQDGAWFGSQAVKDAVLDKLREHRRIDMFMQGDYQASLNPEDNVTGENYRGCALGCMVPFRTTADLKILLDERGLVIDFDQEVELRFGIRSDVANLIDNVFEAQESLEDAGDFAIEVLEAIEPGADLSEIYDSYWDDDTDRYSAEGQANTLIDLLRDAPQVTTP